MKKTSIPSPVSMVLCFLDEDEAKEVESYLNKNNLDSGIVFMGKGTAESDIADIFGFGMRDKSIVACIIPNEKKDKIVENIRKISSVETENYGLIMVLKLGSATSNLLEMMKIKVVSDGQN